jgi:DNA invertase Pin-like site-specific DNA recombinase
VTAARADRRELLRMLDQRGLGDVLTVTRIDRLARSTSNLFGIVNRIVGTEGTIPVAGGTMGKHGTNTGRLILAEAAA